MSSPQSRSATSPTNTYQELKKRNCEASEETNSEPTIILLSPEPKNHSAHPISSLNSSLNTKNSVSDSSPLKLQDLPNHGFSLSISLNLESPRENNENSTVINQFF